MSKKHTNFLLKESGFVISTDHPFIGVSPDGTAMCEYCGEGCVEVKCPFCNKDTEIEERLNKKDDPGQTQLSIPHTYYY